MKKRFSLLISAVLFFVLIGSAAAVGATQADDLQTTVPVATTTPATSQSTTLPTTQTTTAPTTTVQNVVDLSSAGVVVTPQYTSTSYSGEEKKPSVTVTYAGITLVENVDYTLEYSNNVNAGEASVIVKGKGSYSGQVSKSFTIKPLNIGDKSKYQIAFESKKIVYNGERVVPVIYVSYDLGGTIGQKYLATDVDFKVTYSNNNNIGVATAKVVGIGNFTGNFNKKFRIYPAVVEGVKISNVTSSSLVINWNVVSKVSGYEISVYNESSDSYKRVAFVSSKKTSYKVSKLSSAHSYVYRVRAYKTIDGKKYYGDYSADVSTVIKPVQTTVEAVTKSGNKLTVDWKKINCSGYEIEYSTDKKLKKNVKIIDVASSKKTSYTIKGINKSKRYYVKMRAYTIYNGKKHYGARSTIVSSYFSNVYATYSSNYVNNANRTTNLKIASKAISGTIINPGETFSMNAVVGPRTAAKGYKAAPIFTGSGTSDGIGGGICQVASTLFNCALKANVKITERHQHSQRVSYVPLGRDAAIYGTVEDFKWTNNTKYAIQVKMTVKNGVITCTFYTCKRVKPKKVKLNVTQSGSNFKLTRSVGGKVNYTAKSHY